MKREIPKVLKGCERKPTFWHTDIRDIGILEGKESILLCVENLEVVKAQSVLGAG
jgi:hypothetical protein